MSKSSLCVGTMAGLICVVSTSCFGLAARNQKKISGTVEKSYAERQIHSYSTVPRAPVAFLMDGGKRLPYRRSGIIGKDAAALLAKESRELTDPIALYAVVREGSPIEYSRTAFRTLALEDGTDLVDSTNETIFFSQWYGPDGQTALVAEFVPNDRLPDDKESSGSILHSLRGWDLD